MNQTLCLGILTVVFLAASWVRSTESSWPNPRVTGLQKAELICYCRKLPSGKVGCKGAAVRVIKAKTKKCSCSKKGKRYLLEKCPHWNVGDILS